MRFAWISAVAIVLGLAAPVFSAKADVVKFDGIAVDLALPADYCALSRDNPLDKARYAQQDRANGNTDGNSSGNLVLLFAVPCDELASSRAGNPLKHWAIWLELRDPNHPFFDTTGQDHAKIFTDIAGATPRIDLKQISSMVAANLNRKTDPSVNLNTSGVAGQDSDGLYVAITGDLSTAAAKRVIAGMIGYAILSDRIFTFNIYRDFENQDTFDPLVAASKDVVHRATNASGALKGAR